MSGSESPGSEGEQIQVSGSLEHAPGRKLSLEVRIQAPYNLAGENWVKRQRCCRKGGARLEKKKEQERASHCSPLKEVLPRAQSALLVPAALLL